MRSSLIDVKRVPGLEEQASKSASTRRMSKFDAFASNLRSYTPLMPPKMASAVSVPAPNEGWFALVLLAIALYSVVYAIIAANWVHHSVFLLWTPAIGLLVGFVIAKSPYVAQALLHVTACLFGFILAIWLTSAEAFHVPVRVLLNGLRLAFTGQIATEGIATSELVFFFYLTFLCFFLGYFGSWLVYRARLPWLVALVYCSIMLVNLNYVVHDLSYLIIIMLGALILLIARLHLASQVFQWTSEGLYTDRVWLRTINRRCMQVACGITVLVLLASWFLPSQPQPDSGKVLWDRLNNSWLNVVNGRVSLQNLNSLTSPYQASTNFFSDQLTVTGSVHLMAGEVLSYSSSDVQSHYLEGFTYNRFDGHTWTSSVGPDSVQSYGVNEQLPSDVPLGANREITTTVTLTQSLDGTKNYVFGPAQPEKFNLETTIYHDTTNNATSTTAWTTTKQLVKNASYSVTSNLPISDPQSLSGVPLPAEDQNFWMKDPNATYSSSNSPYLLVPVNMSPRVLETVRTWTSGSKNAYEAMQKLEGHLSDQNHFKYSVDNPPIPANQDVLDWLLNTQTGYCTHYATAMAIMARMLHVPTRVAVGFSAGHFRADRKIWSVVGSDAHSWVQAYFPGYGWINFDPTPGFALTNKAVQVAPPVAPRPTPKPKAAGATTASPQKPVVTKPVQPPHTPHMSTIIPAQKSIDYSAMLLPIALGLLFIAIIFFLFALSIRWWRNQFANSSIVSGLFWRVCRIASWAGVGPKKWQTPYEYNRVLSRRFPQKAPLLTHLTDLFVRERWGSPVHVPQAHDEVMAEQLWPDLRALLLRSIVNKGQKQGK